MNANMLLVLPSCTLALLQVCAKATDTSFAGICVTLLTCRGRRVSGTVYFWQSLQPFKLLRPNSIDISGPRVMLFNEMLGEEV